jgi:gas vesicle protein
MEEVCIPVDEINTRRGGSKKSYWKGLLFGGLIGAGIALLAAPRSGEETRWMLREKGAELKEKALSAAEEARLRAEEVARMGAERATDLKERGQSFLDAQKNTLQSAVEGVREGVKTYKENPPEGALAAGEVHPGIVAPLAPAPNTDLTDTQQL